MENISVKFIFLTQYDFLVDSAIWRNRFLSFLGRKVQYCLVLCTEKPGYFVLFSCFFDVCRRGVTFWIILRYSFFCSHILCDIYLFSFLQTNCDFIELEKCWNRRSEAWLRCFFLHVCVSFGPILIVVLITLLFPVSVVVVLSVCSFSLSAVFQGNLRLFL
jgi:hypothetical protein